MAVTVLTDKEAYGIVYTHRIDSDTDRASLANNTYFYQVDEDKVFFKDGTGAILEIFSAAGTGTNFSNTLFVDPNGNDGTGTKGNSSLPFLTLEAARDAASSGDLIYVNAGSYTVTTTDATGLWVDGVNWHFEAGATVTKTSSGYMFDINSATVPFVLSGFGTFRSTSAPFSNTIRVRLSTAYISFNEIENLNGAAGLTIYELNNTRSVTVNGRKMTNASGNCVILDGGNANVLGNVGHLTSTSGTTFSSFLTGPNQNVVWNSSIIENSGGEAMRVVDGTFNVDRVNGSTIGLNITGSNGGEVKFTGNSNSTEVTQGQIVYFNGHHDTLTVGSIHSQVFGGTYDVLTVNNGYVKGHLGGFLEGTASATINDGRAELSWKDNGEFVRFTVTGGDVDLRGDYVSLGSGATLPFLTASGGKTRLHGNFVLFGDTMDEAVLMSGTAKVILDSDCVIDISSQIAHVDPKTAIRYSGGTLISNGGTILVPTPTSEIDFAPIVADGTGLDFKVKSGGFNTNYTTLNTEAAKTARWKFTVNAVATTELSLNDTSGTENFQETDTATYNTTILLAQQMAALINGSATLDMTASWTGGDSFFFVEMDIAGTTTDPFATVISNLTKLSIRENSEVMLDALVARAGGRFVEDTDVE